jgi:peptidoglycan hydrolase-like protein with peptidoglycan-binding domain
MRRLRQAEIARPVPHIEPPKRTQEVQEDHQESGYLNAGQQSMLELQQRGGNQAARRLMGTIQREEDEKRDYTPLDERSPTDHPPEKASARFDDDATMAEIDAGTRVLKWGDRGLAVTKMQQALHDMGYILKQFGVDGIFKNETKKGLIKFQEDHGLSPASGEFDKATSDEFRKIFGTRQPYIDNATYDPADPNKGLRTLNAADKKNVHDAMVPRHGGGGEYKFKEEVGGEHYAAAIQARMDKLVPQLHKELYADRAPLRADPKKNLHEWSTIEGAAGAAKDATDAVYGSYAKGPKLTNAGGNLLDQWEKEEERVGKKNDAEKLAQATQGVIYLIENNCTEINKKHQAIPSRAEEKTLLAPVVASFVDTQDKIDKMLQIDIGWEGTQGGGTINLQRYKAADNAGNRKMMWELFHTSIHEYLHLLKHPDYAAYANSFYSAGDESRYNTLIEGFCDFFTENVRPTVNVTPTLRQQVEGPYYDPNVAPPDVNPATYDAKAQAEQMVSIVGIRNAQEAYFHGDVSRIGGPPSKGGKGGGVKTPAPYEPAYEKV